MFQEKDKSKVELVNFPGLISISQEESEKITSYKEKIGAATTPEEVQKLLKDYVKKIAYDQIKHALANSAPALKEGDLTEENQKVTNSLLDENADSEVKSTKKIRDEVLKDIEEVRSLFATKKELRELFSEEIKERLKLVEANN
ncbi:MAG: hypothetical protein NY202_02560 [Mollicutes bacterium UO1]